jgi:signal transduction histidine kinase/integral membrane sensor domain MASE1
MEVAESEPSKNIATANSGLNVALLACLTAAVCYFAAKLGGLLIIREPQTLWPLWPGCAVLVAILLVIPRKNWAVVLAAGLAGFVVYDLQDGVAIGSIAWLILADILEILLAAWGVHWALGGVPRLNSLRALAKYSFFTVFLASVIVSTIGVYALDGDRWMSWRIIFLSEGLAFLTVAPAILGWVGEAERWARASWAQVFEGCVLMAALISLSYVMFVARSGSYPPALLYSLLPLLLWSALRFGTTGVGTAATIVALLSIWGALHGRGPFIEEDPIDRVLSLQLFLWFAAIPFMILAAQVEERRQAERELREGEERLRLAVEAGRMYAFEWDAATDEIVRSGECAAVLHWKSDPSHDTGREFRANIFPDDVKAYQDMVKGLNPKNPTYKIVYRLKGPGNGLVWMEENGRALFDAQGRVLRKIGIVADITERKRGEEALSNVSQKLIEAQEQERTRIARELHDDLSQRMALLGIGLTQFERSMPELSSDAQERLQNISEVAAEVSSELHSMSHQLHPAKLDLLGLVATVGGHCREVSQQHELRVEFVHHDVGERVPKDVALCLFRIVQEALRNIVKHGKTEDAKVDLSGSGDEIHLCISDQGAGFSPESAQAKGGLGLISMRERLRLIGGHLDVESKPSHGTRIYVRVPVGEFGAQKKNGTNAFKANA